MKSVRGAIWRKHEVSSWCYLKEVSLPPVKLHRSDNRRLFCFGALFELSSWCCLKQALLPPFILDRKKPHPPGGSSISPPMGGSSIWPNKEPGGRRTPSKHLVQILRGRSSSSGPLWGNLPNMRPQRGGLFSAIKLHRHHNRESFCLFFLDFIELSSWCYLKEAPLPPVKLHRRNSRASFFFFLGFTWRKHRINELTHTGATIVGIFPKQNMALCPAYRLKKIYGSCVGWHWLVGCLKC